MFRPAAAELPISRLRPIQISGINLFPGVSKPPNWETSPVETVLYTGDPDDVEPQYILVDGNHRAHRAHLLGRTTISNMVLSEDRHIRDSAALPLERFDTMQGFIDYYERNWLPLLRGRRIITIDTLPVVDWRNKQA